MDISPEGRIGMLSRSENTLALNDCTYWKLAQGLFRDVEIGEFDPEALRFRPVQVMR
jgi:hypothetical protein